MAVGAQPDDKLVSDPGPSAANADALTPGQKRLLAIFRRELENGQWIKPGDTLGTDDATLLRFLRARKFNLSASKRMMTQCIQWRRSVEGVGIDELYATMDPFAFDKREQVFEYWPMWFHKTDKLGRPVNVQLFGAFDVERLHKIVKPEYHWRSILVNCESLTREVLPGASRAAGRKIDNAFCIVDLEGFSLGQFWQIKSLAKACFAVSQDYYPETMGYLAIINAPKSFTAIWQAIKPWLAKETVAKVNVLDDRYAKTLLEHIDAENLPAFLGGTCTCEGLGGCGLSSAGPWLEGRDWANESWREYYPDLRKPPPLVPEKQGPSAAEGKKDTIAKEKAPDAPSEDKKEAPPDAAAASRAVEAASVSA